MADCLEPVQFIGGPLDGHIRGLPIHVVEHLAVAGHPNGGISHHRYRLEWHSRDGKMVRLGVCVDPGEDEQPAYMINVAIPVKVCQPRRFVRFERDKP